MKTTMAAFLTLLGLFAPAAAQTSADPETITFRKIVLTKQFHGEGAGIGDFDGDGHVDVFYGAQWYAGPDFRRTRAIFPVEDFDPHGYSNDFLTVVHDVDGDGRVDVLIHEWPGRAVHWYRNPGADGDAWTKHLVHAQVDNEAPGFGDLTGDGRPELLFTHGGRLGYAAPGPDPTQPWPFVAISAPGSWHRYSHGLGFGDVDGDGRADFLMAEGWWRQPTSVEGAIAASPPPWRAHLTSFGSGGAQMYATDVDGDGDADVITSLAAHGYGLAWFEQSTRDGEIVFTRHEILSADPVDDPDAVRFSQLHAVGLADIDGDGLPDIVTGKRWWAHGPEGDVEADAPAVLYWFQLVRSAEGVRFVPHRIDDDSGVGTQLAIGDVNGDGRPDVVIGNKKGGFVFVQQRSRSSGDDPQPTPRPVRD